MKSASLPYRMESFQLEDIPQSSRTLGRRNGSIQPPNDGYWSNLPKQLNRTLSTLVRDDNLIGLKQRLNTPPAIQRHELVSAFFWACYCGAVDAVTLFLQNSVDVNSKDQFGASGLHHAVNGNSPAVIEVLIEKGIHFADWWMEKESLLHWASRKGHPSVVTCLIDHGQSLFIPDGNGRFPIHSACHFGVSNVIPVLLSYSSSLGSSQPQTSVGRKFSVSRNDYGPDVLDKNRWTPLHYACTSYVGNPREVVHELMKANANPMIKTPNGKTSLDLAFESGRDTLFWGNISASRCLILLAKLDSIHSSESLKETCPFARESAASSCEEDENPESDFFPPVRRKLSRRNKGMNRVRDSYSFLHDDFSQMTKQVKTRHARTESSDTLSTIKDRSLLEIWRRIIRNDDVDLLEILRDFRVHEHQNNDCVESVNSFADACEMEPHILFEIHKSCYENGLAIFSFVKGRYRKELEEYNFREIFLKLTRLDGNLIYADSVEDNPVMIPVPNTVIFIALISGRFRVLEMLLRMRQFDILPALVIVILIIRKLAQETAFTNEVKKNLMEFARSLETLAVNVLNKLSLKDSTEGKCITINFLSKPLGCLGRNTIIDIAAQASCETFLSLPSSQAVIYNLWYGKLNWLPCSWKFMTAICPLLLPLYLTKRQSQERRSTHKNSNPPTYQRSFTKCSVVCKKHYHNIEAVQESSCTDKLKMMSFIFTAPFNKFMFHSIFHVIFLGLFSYVLLYDFHFELSWSEIICHLFILGYMVEEARQILKHLFENRIKIYLHDIKNIIDLFAIIISLIGFGLRFGFHINQSGNLHDITAELMNGQFYGARILFLTALFVFYMRIMFVFSLFSRLGPRIRMMFAMVTNDLLPMLCIFILFFVSFGIIFQGILYPNGYDLTKKSDHLNETFKRQIYTNILKNIVKKSFYGMLAAEYNVEKLDPGGSGDYGDCKNDNCKAIITIGRETVLFVFHILYVLIVNVMLLNLLIALYSYTITDINQKSMAHWLADKYSLTHEFLQRSICPPPLNIICVFAEVIWTCCRFRKMSKESKYVACSCKTMRYLMLQAFALRDQRNKLGQTQVQKAKEISEKIGSIEKQIQSIRLLVSSGKSGRQRLYVKNEGMSAF